LVAYRNAGDRQPDRLSGEYKGHCAHRWATGSGSTGTRTVILDNLPDAAHPEDNYFDLFPGETRQICITRISVEEAERVQVRQGYHGYGHFRKAA